MEMGERMKERGVGLKLKHRVIPSKLPNNNIYNHIKPSVPYPSKSHFSLRKRVTIYSIALPQTEFHHQHFLSPLTPISRKSLCCLHCESTSCLNSSPPPIILFALSDSQFLPVLFLCKCHYPHWTGVRFQKLALAGKQCYTESRNLATGAEDIAPW